jgi:hypothetical protein
MYQSVYFLRHVRTQVRDGRVMSFLMYKSRLLTEAYPHTSPLHLNTIITHFRLHEPRLTQLGRINSCR